MQRLTLLLALMIVLLGAGCATNRDQGPPALLVEVIVPPSSDPLREDDIVRFFVDSVRETFRRRGFVGLIDERYRSDVDRPDVPLLTLRLTEWRRTPTGAVDCTLSAAIRPAHGSEQSLGQFHATELSTTISNRWTLAEAFRHTAERAADDVWQRLAERQLLPGMTGRNR